MHLLHLHRAHMSTVHCVALSPVRPRPQRQSIRNSLITYAAVPQPASQTLKQQLDKLLNSIPTFLDNATQNVETTISSLPERVQHLFSDDGPLGALYFWRKNKESISSTGQQLLESGELLVRGDTKAFREKASNIDLSWLKLNRDSITTLPTNSTQNFALKHQLQRSVLFLIESLSPWDFDRHDFGLTFATIWLNTDANSQAENSGSLVKMTSSIKPLEKEWKLSARTKLFDLGPNTLLLGKAGIFLAGEQPPYIGIEADHVWLIPRLSGTKLFGNVNYRSSRKPQADPFKTTFGIQQDFPIIKSLEITLRLAVNPLDGCKFSVIPIPNGSYF